MKSMPSLSGKHSGFEKPWKLSILFISLIVTFSVLGIVLVDRVSPSGHPPSIVNQDPIKALWWNDLPSADLSGWNTRRTDYITCCSLPPRLQLTENGTLSAYAISTQAMDLSTAASKVLELTQGFRFANAGMVPPFGFFLTRNSTGPSQNKLYNPAEDINVALLIKQGNVFNQTFDKLAFFVYEQRDPLRTISQDDQGCSVGSVFICFTPNVGPTFVPGRHQLGLRLNYTGGTLGASNSVLSFLYDYGPGSYTSSNMGRLPAFNIQGQKYYFGFWVGVATLVNRPFNFTAPLDFFQSISDPTASACGTCNKDNSMLVNIYIPPTITPSLDTGGFFGPLIKALVSLGAFILQGVFTVFGFIWIAFKTGLNLLGNFVGLGALGDALADAFQGFATWITQVFGTVFGQVLNIATFVGNGVTGFGSVAGTFFDQANSALSQLSNIGSQFWGVMNTIGFVGKVGIGFVIGGWFLWGTVMAFDNSNGTTGYEKWKTQWFDVTGIFFLKVFRGLWWVGESAYGMILKVKSIIHPLSSGGGTVEAPS